MNSLNALLLDRYRCPAAELPDFELSGKIKDSTGFFRFGPEAVCYGKVAGETRSAVTGDLFDASSAVIVKDRTVSLPFEPKEVIDNLRYERYSDGQRRWLEKPGARSIYYGIRPLLPDSFRRRLQKAYLRGWDNLRFPTWPVDRSVDVVYERLLALTLKASGKSSIPFIWFWPSGHKACAIVTHDIETTAGRDFTPNLLDIDAEFGVNASVQIVPEKRYEVPGGFLDEIRRRGSEINVHGLNHEGNLFQDRHAFLECARKINRYAELFGARGFRSPVMYRKSEWFQDLKFSYDMSVPNVAHFEPQPGGCCTLLPYSLPGGMTELPLTTIQDYALFHMLNDYSTTLWKQQMKMILEGYGLMSFIIHPDYVQSSRAQDVYRQLLGELDRERAKNGVWVTLPGEVDRWWRERNQMRLVPVGTAFEIEGPGAERATLAYATLEGDRIAYDFPNENPAQTVSPSLAVKVAR